MDEIINNLQNSPQDRRPTIGITMGDPAGIGPEIILKALSDPQVRRRANFVIYGMHELMAYAADRAEIDPFWWRCQHDQLDFSAVHGVVVADYDELLWQVGSTPAPSAAGGTASMQFVCPMPSPMPAAAGSMPWSRPLSARSRGNWPV